MFRSRLSSPLLAVNPVLFLVVEGCDCPKRGSKRLDFGLYIMWDFADRGEVGLALPWKGKSAPDNTLR